MFEEMQARNQAWMERMEDNNRRWMDRMQKRSNIITWIIGIVAAALVFIQILQARNYSNQATVTPATSEQVDPQSTVAP